MVKIFLSSQTSGLALEPTQTSVQWVPWSFLGDKVAWREVDHSLPPVLGLLMRGTISQISLYAFMAREKNFNFHVYSFSLVGN
jgi:hypothetical protein